MCCEFCPAVGSDCCVCRAREDAAPPGSDIAITRAEFVQILNDWDKAAKRDQPANARFWVWEANGWCKLTLKPGYTIERKWETFAFGSYRIESLKWTHEGDYVRQDYGLWSRQGEYASERVCPLSELRTLRHVADVPDYVDGLPQWQTRG